MDKRKIRRETLERYQRVVKLKADNQELTLDIACQRAGISKIYFFRLRKLDREGRLEICTNVESVL